MILQIGQEEQRKEKKIRLELDSADKGEVRKEKMSSEFIHNI